RILSSAYGAGSRSFAYDRWGNLLQNGSLTYPVDGAHNRLIVGGSTSAVSYDGRGNLTVHNADAMSYDSLDRLYRNQSGSSDFVFIHNGVGERLVKFPGNKSLARREMARLVGEANKAAGKTGWSTAPDACLGTFSDVPCSDADAGWIQTLYDHGTAAGCGGSQFCPDPPGGTLNRAQMAVFVVKGYRADGAAVPPCTGIFADVPCSGASPWVPFAPYIEQLSRDNVTAGCGGSNFCPGNPVTPWQILVWMSKTPAVPGSGRTWASVYHPVPRGSIYTLRDEQNRVVTEMTDASSGSASATLGVQRDNVFFGGLLVASNSAGTWSYDVSDHLGSVRKMWSTAGTVTESHGYWPYGEDTNTGPPNQHLSFQAMERNDGVAQHFDHARTQHYSLGRFMSTDAAGGHPKSPQSWNRYSYTLGNPMKHIDPDGLLTILVHGTQLGGRTTDFTPPGAFFNHVATSIGDRTTVSYNWSGGDTHAARVDAAKGLAEFIRAYKFAPGEGLDIIAHSHGGNVAIAAINMGLRHKVDNLVTLGTPSTPSYRLDGTAGVSNWVNVFNVFDKVQTHGGGADGDRYLQYGPAARIQPLATNVELDEDFGDVNSHSWLHSSEAWDRVFPYLNTIQAFGDRSFMWIQR
ncbi:MAG TPA: RHS repeat-associated core domain-containing protein, partial [Sphingomicrobium sp.]|nr:RHS repeat-associated core domain-containing protein [Sphingomicrobium sp.]